ncbi:MAG: 3-isopropylmalate dehydratase small subunit [Burkholderiaceae bacterium]|nr:3-isopropylmalate dehydratase small subunit [Burkholderiaceae bacterium]
MQAFTVHQGLVAPLDRENVDTDAIIPKQFLKSIARTGFGPNLFDEWRYLDKGEPGQDPAARKPNPDFVLNQPRYLGASILLARRNFGCGSSREQVARLFDAVAAFPGYALTVDLPRQVVVEPDGSELPFDVAPFRKYCLINGYDDIGLTLRHADKIRVFEAERLARLPWLDHRSVG